MKAVLRNLQCQPCRERQLSENETNTFSDYSFLQRYFPALDSFKIPDTTLSNTLIELPSKYYIDSWIKPEDSENKIMIANRASKDSTSIEQCKVFIKTVHLLNPIDVIKERYIIPKHPLLPQSGNTWKKTLTKIHSRNNQAYVDTIANFVLSRFRELNLTPHCNYFYGATTGISNSYKFNISQEFDTFRHCRWFWKGIKAHNAKLSIVNNEFDESDEFDDICKEFTMCPFDETDMSDEELDMLCTLETNAIDNSDLESIKSFTFESMDENIKLDNNIFKLKKTSLRQSLKQSDTSSESESKSSKSSESSESNCLTEDDNNSSSNDSEDTFDYDFDVCLEIPNMPVILIQQEAQDGVMDDLLEEDAIDTHKRGSQGWEMRWIAWLFQIIATLSFLQNAICFTHNDLHTNNIIWRDTDKKFLYYKSKSGTVWRVPTFGKIFSIIDFGRSIFRLGRNLWVSDDHWPDQDAGEQYNFGPFFDNSRPKNPPNQSFDLCRLAVSLIDGLYNEKPPKKRGKTVRILSEEDGWKVYETQSPLFNLLWSWTIDDNGCTVYEDKEGNEKYDGFDLYIRIAHDVHNSVPKDQFNKSIFQQYKWTQKIPQNEILYSLGV